MRRYETIFIARPNVGEDDIEAIIKKTSEIIEGDGGTIIRIDKWGLKKLAYLIKKESQGYYIYADYASIPASVSEIERIFRIDDRILKYLTVKLADTCDPEAVKEQLAQEAPAEDPDAQVEDSEAPAKEPGDPVEDSETPAKEPEDPVEDSETPAKEPEAPVEDSSDQDKDKDEAEAGLPDEEKTD